MEKVEKYTLVTMVGLVAITIVGTCICAITSLIQPHEVVQELFKFIVLVPMGILLVIAVLSLLYMIGQLIIYLINEEE